jgi:DNA-binding MurR/RpiR family transcriptional regulator
VPDDPTAPTAVRERVRDHLPSLTSAERKVAHVLLAAYPIAGLESVTALAERAGVSPPTVTRFVTKVGFDGYRSFQHSLRTEVQDGTSSPLVRYERNGSDVATLHDRLDELATVVTGAGQTITPTEFDATVRILADTRRTIWCTGGRLSHIAAEYLSARLQQLRAGTHYVVDGPMPRIDHLVDVGRRDALVVFDLRRYQPETVEFAHAASDGGATVVLFTDRWLSPIAEVADHVLVTPVETSSPYDSLVAVIAVVEALVTALIAAMPAEGKRRMTALEELRQRHAAARPPGGQPLS